MSCPYWLYMYLDNSVSQQWVIICYDQHQNICVCGEEHQLEFCCDASTAWWISSVSASSWFLSTKSSSLLLLLVHLATAADLHLGVQQRLEGGEVIHTLQMLWDATEVTEALLSTSATFTCAAYCLHQMASNSRASLSCDDIFYLKIHNKCIMALKQLIPI